MTATIERTEVDLQALDFHPEVCRCAQMAPDGTTIYVCQNRADWAFISEVTCEHNPVRELACDSCWQEAGGFEVGDEFECVVCGFISHIIRIERITR